MENKFKVSDSDQAPAGEDYKMEEHPGQLEGRYSKNTEDEVESAKAEMNQVRQENTRLKMLLEQIQKDYNSLRMKFIQINSNSEAKNLMMNGTTHANYSLTSLTNPPAMDIDREDHVADDEVEPELVSLRLGISPSNSAKKEENTSSSSKTPTRDDHEVSDEGDKEIHDGLRLGLDYNNFEASNQSNSDAGAGELNVNESSPGNSLVVVETKEDQEAAGGETWPPSKVLKTMRSGDEESLQPGVKRARVSVRARCDTPTMNDGCQWRKYGQKIAKGNPCPRAYYRCTVAPSCPVRKQVQRCADDMSILITTYEGTHNHPLPISATAMASTTSAAASMLLSGSSTSQSGFGHGSSPSVPTSAAIANLHGLNFYASPDTSRTRPFYLPNSTSPPFPTITLDLTTSNPSSSSPSQFSIFSPSSNAFHSNPRLIPSTSLSFSSSSESNILPTIWANNSTYLNYSTLNKSSNIGSTHLGRSSQDQHAYPKQPYSEKTNPAQHSSQQAANLTETLTKAITSDPSFRSVLAAAISSMVAGDPEAKTEVNHHDHVVRGEGFAQNLKKMDDQQIRVLNSNPVPVSSGKGCGSGYLNRSLSNLSSQDGSLMKPVQPQFPFSITKSSSVTLDETREQV